MNTLRYLNGYVLIHLPQHPTAMSSDNWNEWVYEHIVIAERKLGRALRDNEVVHHLDLDRGNNSPENLLVLERSQHGVIHKWVDRGAPISKDVGVHGVNSGKSKLAEPRRCAICTLTLSNQQLKYCCCECANSASRLTSNKPDKDTLSKLIKTTSWVGIGRLYSVSDNAVRKWARSYGLI